MSAECASGARCNARLSRGAIHSSLDALEMRCDERERDQREMLMMRERDPADDASEETALLTLSSPSPISLASSSSSSCSSSTVLRHLTFESNVSSRSYRTEAEERQNPKRQKEWRPSPAPHSTRQPTYSIDPPIQPGFGTSSRVIMQQVPSMQ